MQIVVREMDNAGLENNAANISSMTEYNGNVYVTTLGGGVYFSNIENFKTASLIQSIFFGTIGTGATFNFRSWNGSIQLEGLLTRCLIEYL